MPRNNKQDELTIYFNTPDAGRRYIAKLFETVLRRHDNRQYINERLAGDFACTLAQHFEEMKAREAALQLLLNERDEQLTSLEQRRYAEQQAREAAECMQPGIAGCVAETWKQSIRAACLLGKPRRTW